MGSGYPLEFTPYLIRGGYDEQTEFINRLLLVVGVPAHEVEVVMGLAGCRSITRLDRNEQ